MSSTAPAVNSVTLVGRLTADPVLKQLDENRKVCDLRLAVNDQRNQPPLFIDVATFGASAEACAKYLAKGRQIAVTGRLIYREWEADGPPILFWHALGDHSSMQMVEAAPVIARWFGYRVIGQGFVIGMGSVDSAAQHLHTIYHDLGNVLGRAA